MFLTQNHFLGAQAFIMTQCWESTALSTMWISVQIENSGNANTSEIFASFYKLKKKSCKLQGN